MIKCLETQVRTDMAYWKISRDSFTQIQFPVASGGKILVSQPFDEHSLLSTLFLFCTPTVALVQLSDLLDSC